MPDSMAFLDTNILVYAYSASEPAKSLIARKLLATRSVVVSAQVINEFVAVTYRKLNLPIETVQVALDEILSYVSTVPLTSETTCLALELLKTYKLSWYDSLIVAAAKIAGCDLLFTEDMHHGLQVASGPIIINPFQPG
jgi:predicted nucleic acid-binding protein